MVHDQIIRRFTPDEWKYECRVFLWERYEDKAEIVHEYIDEAEAQDGDEYWMKFQDLHAVRLDFEIYLIHR